MPLPVCAGNRAKLTLLPLCRPAPESRAGFRSVCWLNTPDY
jgi:hypothetical protein